MPNSDSDATIVFFSKHPTDQEIADALAHFPNTPISQLKIRVCAARRFIPLFQHLVLTSADDKELNNGQGKEKA